MAVTLRSRALRGTNAGTTKCQCVEVVDETTPDDTVERIESYWKNTLLTREFGSNRD
jgi:hypothetical protein